ncbi:MarR family winged helix-turn-helix transcriptional regulator [uncultured Arthrobacter sp.]|uniref:MarR family winged helix-turn-helix transcriptional regulator n=1 Tax=uncultured Arthrobacter sp. TaxID=114050 RepID=UPI00261B9F3E|nr:MarR family transcriptional regulator [uncultured Arthrobacter sp.]
MDIAQWPTNRLLNTAARLSSNRENERLRRLGTTHAGLLTLRVLGRTNSITQVELARELRVQAQTTGKLLERLEARGLIVRTRIDDDRRVFIANLTPAGVAMLQRARAMEDEEEQATDRSDAVLREELIAHIRDLGGFPHAAEQRNLRVVAGGHPEDAPSARDLTAG